MSEGKRLETKNSKQERDGTTKGDESCQDARFITSSAPSADAINRVSMQHAQSGR